MKKHISRGKIAYEFLTKNKKLPLSVSTSDFQVAATYVAETLKEDTKKQVKDLSQHVQEYLSYSDISVMLIVADNKKWLFVESNDNTHIEISEKNVPISKIDSFNELTIIEKEILKYNEISSSEDSMMKNANIKNVFGKFLGIEKSEYEVISIGRCRFKGISVPLKLNEKTIINIDGVQSEQDGILIGEDFVISVEAKMERKDIHTVKILNQLFIQYWRNKLYNPEKNVSSIFLNYNENKSTYYLLQVIFEDCSIGSMKVLREAKYIVK